MISTKHEKLEGSAEMGKYYVINKVTKTVESERDSHSDARRHISNACSLFGKRYADYEIAAGAKQRDAKLKELKKG